MARSVPSRVKKDKRFGASSTPSYGFSANKVLRLIRAGAEIETTTKSCSEMVSVGTCNAVCLSTACEFAAGEVLVDEHRYEQGLDGTGQLRLSHITVSQIALRAFLPESLQHQPPDPFRRVGGAGLLARQSSICFRGRDGTVRQARRVGAGDFFGVSVNTTFLTCYL